MMSNFCQIKYDCSLGSVPEVVALFVKKANDFLYGAYIHACIMFMH